MSLWSRSLRLRESLLRWNCPQSVRSLPRDLLTGCRVCYIAPQYVGRRWMRNTNLACQPLRVNKHSAEVRPVIDVCLLWWIDSSNHFFLFHFHATFLPCTGFSSLLFCVFSCALRGLSCSFWASLSHSPIWAASHFFFFLLSPHWSSDTE